jgi:D-alanyl-lipoteichoic acid acyltransferase DltB (MBOAT superfamily)
MNFAEARFWGLLLAGLGIIALLRFLLRYRSTANNGRFDKLALSGLGLGLLLCTSPATFLIFLVVAIGSYVGLQWVLQQAEGRQKHYLYVLIPLQLLPLLYYKYANFAVNGVLGLDVSTLRNLVIPVGVSFYSFQKVAFVVDTLVFRQPLPHWLDYMNFAGFFPQIVAGPIERRGDLLPQMEQFRFRWSPANLNEGATWIALGLFFKLCLANNLAAYFDGAPADNAWMIWMNNLVFGLRIYYDFAGYSLVAVGLGLCLGVRLTLNFRSPYCATSSMEFWRRWHITLSQWFRDYLYIPLGGGRVRWWAFNLALVFVVSGIWHGAGWNFLIWGALHGVALIINRLLGRRFRLPAFPAWGLTMLTCFCAWLCFYETQTVTLILKMKTLFTPAAYGPAAWQAFQAKYNDAGGFVLGGLLALTGVVLALEWLSIARRDTPYYFLRRPVMLGLLIALTVILAPEKDNGFIYFAF